MAPIARNGVPLSKGRGEAIVMGLVKAFLAGVAQGAGDLKPAGPERFCNAVWPLHSGNCRKTIPHLQRLEIL